MAGSEVNATKQQSDNGPWYKNASTVIALIAMIISIVSAGASAISAATGAVQARTASQQNTEAQQQQLLTLVAAIAQEPGQVAQESAAFKNNQAAFVTANAGTLDTEIANSEEAAAIIRSLHGHGVTPIEYFEIAGGLAAGQDNAQALDFFGKAAILGADPRTRASALRGEAEIYYELGRISAAKHDIALAEHVFKGVKDVPVAVVQENTVLTELFDAYFQTTISCAAARSELRAAQETISKIPSILTPIVANQEAQDEKNLQLNGC